MNKYFVTVFIYSDTTKLGRIVANKVYDKYHESLVTEGKQLDMIVEFITKAMEQAIIENHRLKRMTIKKSIWGNFFDITLGSFSSGCDKFAFTVMGEIVRHDYCEKGGEQ